MSHHKLEVKFGRKGRVREKMKKTNDCNKMWWKRNKLEKRREKENNNLFGRDKIGEKLRGESRNRRGIKRLSCLIKLN